MNSIQRSMILLAEDAKELGYADLAIAYNNSALRIGFEILEQNCRRIDQKLSGLGDR